MSDPVKPMRGTPAAKEPPKPASPLFGWAFWLWLAAFPLVALALFSWVERSQSLAIAYALPLLGLIALIAVPSMAVTVGAITRTLKASLLGVLLGLLLVPLGAQLMQEVDSNRWQAEYDEFQHFGSLVLGGDRAAIAAGLDGLRHFNQTEAMCVLASDDSQGGGLGYLLPDAPEAGRTRLGTPYVVANERLFLVADIIVSGKTPIREKQAVLFNLLQALDERDAQPRYDDWLRLWLRTRPAVAQSDPLHFDGVGARDLKGYCSSGDDAQLASLAQRVRIGPAADPSLSATPAMQAAHHAAAAAAAEAQAAASLPPSPPKPP
ncbi:hypothetical protein [Luteimonas panaciterrae]|uniref:hypothetical protein n=1 Tax=Luteimonas panaciterrae TaxID=363885 RepID=UPI001CFBB4C6|nr:hypothetical protein [Luteimonas panaciterrae]